MQSENLPVQAGHVYYPIEALERMAQAIAKSQLFGMKSPEQALALMLTAQAEGQHPATITQDYDIVQGRPARKTHSVLARFQQAGGTVQWHDLTEQKACATFSHRSGGSLKIEWTMAMAEKAKLTSKDNWKNYPRAMLRARCIAEGVRAVFPGAIGGMLVAEEAQDITGDVPEGNATVLVERPRAKSEAAGPATIEGEVVRREESVSAAQSTPASDGQLKMIRSKAAAAAITEEEILREFKLEKLEGISVLSGNLILEFIKDPAGTRAK